jgi:predicted Zn finger-like uncharacterized protein
MQFSCESCKANLQIADERIRGKRLIVRCKRCGVQIRIVDPALQTPPRGTPPSGRPKVSSALPRGAATPPGGVPPAGSPSSAPAPRRGWEAEDTRAMDSEVLEKALRASKPEEAASAFQAAPAPRVTPPPPPRDPPAPRDAPVWFAIVQGKQLGPITRAELALQASAGQVGPRTYLWKEGMESWIRAKEVTELVPFFAAPPTPPPPPAEETPAAQSPGAPHPRRELPFETRAASGGSQEREEPASPDAPTPPGGMRIPGEARPAGVSREAPAPQPGPMSPDALDLARWGASELSKPRAQTPATLPKASPIPPAARQFGRGGTERRGPVRAFLAVVALLVVGGLAAFALLYEWRDRAPPASSQEEAAAGPAASSAGEPKPEEKPAANPTSGAPAAAALSPDDLKRKVDESKPILQGCVDEALQRDPSLRVGKILITTTIAPSGAVTSARIDQRAVDQSPLGACLKSAAQKIQFAPFAGDAVAVDIPVVVTGAP